MSGINPHIVFPELRLTEHQTDLLKRLGCPAGHMPYRMQPLNPQHGVIFMWNTWNPFQPPGKWEPPLVVRKMEDGGLKMAGDTAPPSQFWVTRPGQLPAMMDSCVGDAKWRVLVKMFGWIERVGQLALGNFNPEVHIVREERQRALDDLVRAGKATVFMADDPETQRSHFILWQATFAPCPAWPRGLKYLFDESPRASEGEWVNPNGDRGEGQYVYRSTGANWYKRYIRAREMEWGICDGLAEQYGRRVVGEKTLHPCVALRRGDPRGFATEESTATGTRSLFELYLEDHSKEHPDSYPMLFTPAKIRRASSLDIDILIDLFRYDEDKAQREGGMTAENTPMRLVSSRCENWIRAALNYTLTDLGKADEDNPHRDPIDADRYLNSGETPFMESTPNPNGSGGAWT
jgi:hypothetical protein